MPIVRAAKGKLILYTVALSVTLGVSLALHSDAQRCPPRFGALTPSESAAAAEEIGKPELFACEPAEAENNPVEVADSANLTDFDRDQ